MLLIQRPKKRAATLTEILDGGPIEWISRHEHLPTINHRDQDSFAAIPVVTNRIEHDIALRSFANRLAQDITPPCETHLAEHWFLGAGDNPSEAPIKLKSYA